MVSVLLLGFLLTVLTIAIHAIGTTAGIGLLKKRHSKGTTPPGLFRLIHLLCWIGAFLLLMHFVESACWAFAYNMFPGITQLESFEDAMYFSMVTFTSLGYGDIVLDRPFRILCGIEAMNGLMIFGWSTALFFAVLQRLWEQYESDGPGISQRK